MRETKKAGTNLTRCSLSGGGGGGGGGEGNFIVLPYFDYRDTYRELTALYLGAF